VTRAEGTEGSIGRCTVATSSVSVATREHEAGSATEGLRVASHVRWKFGGGRGFLVGRLGGGCNGLVGVAGGIFGGGRVEQLAA
jgi:hypothetical protein